MEELDTVLMKPYYNLLPLGGGDQISATRTENSGHRILRDRMPSPYRRNSSGAVEQTSDALWVLLSTGYNNADLYGTIHPGVGPVVHKTILVLVPEI